MVILITAQMGLLGTLLPVLIAEDIPLCDEYCQNFLLLRKICDLMLAPELLEDEVAYLQVLIEEHHSNFKCLYRSQSITPNMHFMIHVPRLILEYLYHGNMVHVIISAVKMMFFKIH